eukprot:CAMPEP_0119166836 /NCGR_PEP_ID=MMETSP1315-20130426/6143_1 /TAXON_ID=676789 /ORGANISM="Prasinoderma singularis, Strain RCC927" /LENGTH=77 /DNA_ID=CAMNT_0007160245 /DNA_START=17 /DNA_END=250 /DNA_ORIENTATION=+
MEQAPTDSFGQAQAQRGAVRGTIARHAIQSAICLCTASLPGSVRRLWNPPFVVTTRAPARSPSMCEPRGSVASSSGE